MLAAVALLSAAVIAYEILLTRLFSIVLWHHFAYMIISIALLGFGASGSFLAFARRRLAAHFVTAFAGFAGLFGVSAVAGFVLAQAVPFNPLEIIWDPGQQLRLLQIYLALALPFFAAATAIGLALTSHGPAIAAIYRADLLGAGLGAVLIVGLLFLLPSGQALATTGALGLLAAALAAAQGRGGWRAAVLPGLLAVLLLGCGFLEALAPRPSPYKGLSLALTVPDSRVLVERSGPLAQLTVVESPRLPFRHAPGLSLTATVEPPEQLGLFTDAGGMTAITRFDGELAPLAYLDQQTAALPFHLRAAPRSLILGAGGGSDVLLALYHGATEIDAVELNPQVADLLRDDFADFSGHLYERQEVRLHLAEARSFVEASERHWELIQVSLLESFAAATAGLQALAESPLYTVEATTAYLDRLAPGGLLAITRWLRVPPRDNVKLLATVSEALARQGVADPGRRLAMIRGWGTATLLVKNGELSEAEIASLRDFAESRAFDVVWYPGMAATAANRFNRLEQPTLHAAADALLGPGRADFLADYRFHVTPASDDSPYFFRFFRWGLLPELLATRQRGALILLDSGYLVLLLTLAQAVLVSLALILLPLIWLKPRAGERAELGRGPVAVYFLALGLGFRFVEIAFLQRFTLFLGHPLAAIAVVLAAFLVFAGLGSGLSRRLAGQRPRQAIGLAAGTVCLLSGLYLLVLPVLLPTMMALALPLRVILAVGLIAPLALAMGMPFPLGLGEVSRRAPGLVPWAWAVNGSASVVGAVLAGLLSMHLGFAAVVGLALGLYLLAALALRPA
jgi:hypothetical protein